MRRPAPIAATCRRQSVTGEHAVAAAVPFKLVAPSQLVGLPRQRVTLLTMGSQRAAMVGYGENLGGMVVIERRADSHASGASSGSGLGGLSLPTRVDQRRQGPGALDPARHGADVHARRCQLHGAGLGPGDRGGAGSTGAVTDAAAAPASAAAPIEVRGLVKRYGELTAVAGVDLTVNAGDVYGYLGPNGAGKTTSLRMMLGLIRPTEGTVRLFGRDPMQSVRALEGVAGFVEAPAFYPYLSARRNLELLAAFDGGGASGRIDQALGTVELTGRASDKVGGYSHGMRQRLGIAAALLREPKLMLLDEPATGLDPGGMRDMRLLITRLAQEGMTVLLSSHLLAEVEELCNRVAIVRSGLDRLRGRDLRAEARRRNVLPAAHDRRCSGAGRVRRRRPGSPT